MKVVLAIVDDSLNSRLALVKEVLRMTENQAILVDAKPDVFQRSLEFPKTDLIVLNDLFEGRQILSGVPVAEQIKCFKSTIDDNINEIPEIRIEKRPKAFRRLEERIKGYRSHKIGLVRRKVRG